MVVEDQGDGVHLSHHINSSATANAGWRKSPALLAVRAPSLLDIAVDTMARMLCRVQCSNKPKLNAPKDTPNEH